METITGLLLAQLATLVSIVSFGWRLMRFVHRIEFKVDLLWQDYESRIERLEAAPPRRSR